MIVGIVGCGVVGAAIAYTLSQLPDLDIRVWDQRAPEQWGATGAALGVLMAAISPKLKGNHLRLRLASLPCYDTWIPELQQSTGIQIPYNRQGIVQLCFEANELERWQTTQAARHQQGFQLEILDRDQLLQRYPRLGQAQSGDPPLPVVGAIYSPQDRQLDPIALTQALITAARQNGVQFQFQTPVQHFRCHTQTDGQHVTHVCTKQHVEGVDWLVLTSGLGVPQLTATLNQTVPLQPVLGQALHLRLAQPIPFPSPVIYAGGVHLVPLSLTELWVGATVEFPFEDPPARIQPDPQQLDQVRQQAIALYPPLAAAELIRTWSGLRPRPLGRPAPIIERLAGYENVVLATGHYRNGMLLAPVTATKVRDLIISGTGSICD